jgi:hypothetical protein
LSHSEKGQPSPHWDARGILGLFSSDSWNGNIHSGRIEVVVGRQRELRQRKLPGAGRQKQKEGNSTIAPDLSSSSWSCLRRQIMYSFPHIGSCPFDRHVNLDSPASTQWRREPIGSAPCVFVLVHYIHSKTASSKPGCPEGLDCPWTLPDASHKPAITAARGRVTTVDHHNPCSLSSGLQLRAATPLASRS